MTSDQRKVWHLRRIDLFASMIPEEIEHLATLLDDHFVPPGAELLGNRELDRVFLVKRGAVRLYEELNGHQVTLALLGPGRLFGLSSTFGDDSPALSAQTMTESYICFPTWPRLMDVLSGHPEVVLRMMRGLAEHVFRAETWLARLGTHSPRARLADLLIELSDEFGELAPDGRRPRRPDRGLPRRRGDRQAAWPDRQGGGGAGDVRRRPHLRRGRRRAGRRRGAAGGAVPGRQPPAGEGRFGRP